MICFCLFFVEWPSGPVQRPSWVEAARLGLSHWQSSAVCGQLCLPDGVAMEYVSIADTLTCFMGLIPACQQPRFLISRSFISLKASDTSDSHQSVWCGTDFACSRVQVHSHPGTRPEPRRLPLFLALKWWEQAFQNQTEVFANIFWPSCLPIFISFIFGKRKFPDRGLGIRLFSGQRVPVPPCGLREGGGGDALASTLWFPTCQWMVTLPTEGRGGAALASAAGPVSLQLWPLPGERRCRVIEAAAQVEGLSRDCFHWNDAFHGPVQPTRPCRLGGRQLSTPSRP